MKSFITVALLASSIASYAQFENGRRGGSYKPKSWSHSSEGCTHHRNCQSKKRGGFGTVTPIDENDRLTTTAYGYSKVEDVEAELASHHGTTNDQVYLTGYSLSGFSGFERRYHLNYTFDGVYITCTAEREFETHNGHTYLIGLTVTDCSSNSNTGVQGGFPKYLALGY